MINWKIGVFSKMSILQSDKINRNSVLVAVIFSYLAFCSSLNFFIAYYLIIIVFLGLLTLFVRSILEKNS
jgi:hypothetical protein